MRFNAPFAPAGETVAKRMTVSNRLLQSQAGNILPMAAAGMMVMAAMVGGGVDMSRAYKVQSRLQSACDAGVLAGRRAVTSDGFTTAAEDQARKYFDVNYDEASQGTNSTSFDLDATASGNTINATASTQMPMLIMQLFNQEDMTINTTCSATMGVGNSDVTMVLDVTGSMTTSLSGGGTRLSALKAAMKNFYNTVEASTEGSNARVRYGFVPFSTTVNVGQLVYDLNPDYLVDQWTIQSRAPVFNTITEQVRVGWNTPVITSATDYSDETNSNYIAYTSTQYNTLAACTPALPANTNWANNGAATTTTGTTINGSGQQVQTTTTDQPQSKRTYTCRKSGSKYRRYYYETYRSFYTYVYATSDPILETRTRQEFARWEYRPVNYDVSKLKAGESVAVPIGSNGTNVNLSWDGCIEERQTVPETSFTFTNGTGMDPSDAFDLDIDMIPTNEPETKWAPLWRGVSYTRNSVNVSNSGSAATSYCVTPAQALQEMDKDAFDDYADSLSAVGNTYLDIGMIWGARLTSPDGIFGDLVKEDPANGGNVQRHVIFMTDGKQEANPARYTSYGIENLDHRISGDDGTDDLDDRHSARFMAVCEAIRAKGIRVWTIDFSGASEVNADLVTCASPSSSFRAASSTQLNSAFQEIAKQVGELRVMQ